MEPEINGEGYTDVSAKRIIVQDDMLVAPEVAQWLRIGLSTTSEWAKTGKIPCIKLNGLLRFLRKDIEAWLTAQRVTSSLEIQSLRGSPATIPSVSTNLLYRTARHVLRDRVPPAKRDSKRTPSLGRKPV